jgi:hypothetical protein
MVGRVQAEKWEQMEFPQAETGAKTPQILAEKKKCFHWPLGRGSAGSTRGDTGV